MAFRKKNSAILELSSFTDGSVVGVDGQYLNYLSLNLAEHMMKKRTKDQLENEMPTTQCRNGGIFNGLLVAARMS